MLEEKEIPSKYQPSRIIKNGDLSPLTQPGKELPVMQELDFTPNADGSFKPAQTTT